LPTRSWIFRFSFQQSLCPNKHQQKARKDQLEHLNADFAVLVRPCLGQEIIKTDTLFSNCQVFFGNSAT
jgi:hypothetical protein